MTVVKHFVESNKKIDVKIIAMYNAKNVTCFGYQVL